MEHFKSFGAAEAAAQKFFSDNFNYNDGVGFEKTEVNVYSFYSKNDPAMDDTFDCIIDSSAEDSE